MTVKDISRSRPAVTLTAVCLAAFIVPMALSGAALALPSIGRDLHADIVPLQWVVNSYNVVAASFMLAAGSIADIVGRRRIFGAGVVLYTASSVVSAAAPSVLVLDLARGIAGLGAAAIMTAGTAILANTFEGAARTKAFALIGVTVGAGLALGPSLSGLLVGDFSWRAIFVVHAVIALVSLLCLPFIGESRNPDASKVDWAGTITFTLGLVLLTLWVIEVPQSGWLAGDTLVLLGGFAVMMIAFVVAERRQREPMFDLNLFRERRFVGINVLATAVSFGFVGLVVLLPSYFIGAGGITDGMSGLIMLLLTVPVLIFPMVAGRLVRTGVPMRVVLGGSLVLIAAGCGWLTVIDPEVGVLAVAGPMLLVGLGVGLIYGLMDGAAVTTVPPARAGMAAGMFNTIRLATEAIAVAAMVAAMVSLIESRLAAGFAPFAGKVPGDPGSLADSVAAGDLAGPVGGASVDVREAFNALLEAGYTDALRLVLWGAAAICAVSAVVVYRMLAERTEEPVAPTPAERAPMAQPS
jgi:hypothetical protein